MHEPKLKGKSYVIPKRLLWDAWHKVKENGGAAGADGITIEQYEENLAGNLYRLWNRMSSGSYFPGPVRAVEIPKKGQKGQTRVLGIPNVADRIAQTAAALALEPGVEPIFHQDSYAYRPGRAPVHAVAVCRERCFQKDWGKRGDKTVMKEGMRTPYVEVLATHDGPESCVGDPRGRSEALTGVRAGWAIELRNHLHRGADAVPVGGRQHRRRRYRESSGDPAQSGNLRMHGAFMSENPESPRSPVVVMAGRAARGRPRP